MRQLNDIWNRLKKTACHPISSQRWNPRTASGARNGSRSLRLEPLEQRALLSVQSVSPDPAIQTIDPGDSVVFEVEYTTSPANANLSGLGLRMHYDSSVLTLDTLSSVLGTGFIGQSSPSDDSSSDYDSDPDTDKFVLVSWADIAPPSDWPGTVPVDLFTAEFTSSLSAVGSTSINFTASDTADGWNFDGTSATVNFSSDPPPIVTVDALTTSDNTPALTGTVDDPAATVELTVAGNAYPAVNNGDGTWSLADDTIAPALVDGVYDVAVSAEDAAGNVGNDATTNELTIDTTPPAVTANTLTTSDTTPPLTGTVDDPAATIEVTVAGNTYAAVNNGDGTWSLADDTIAPPLGNGVYDVEVSAEDAAGNVGNDATTNELTVDTNLPAVTVNTFTTSDTTPPLTGTVDDLAATIEVTVAGNTYAAVNNGDGTWTLADDTITPPLVDGVYDVAVSAEDSAGNVGNDTTTSELTIDVTPPTVTVNTLTTSDTSPALGGLVDDPAATVELTVAGNAYPAVNNGDGTWALADNTINPPLSVDIYDIQVTAIDAFNNVGNDSTVDELSIIISQQIVTVGPVSQSVNPGDAVVFDVKYTTSPVNANLSGLGLRMHYDSSVLTLDTLSSVLGTGFIGQSSPSDDSSNDYDSDPDTDKFVLVSWADIAPPSDWPGTVPVDLFTAEFTSSLSAIGSTSINFTASDTADGWEFDSTSTEITFITVNDQPVANAQSVPTPEDTAVAITLTGEDGDPEVVQTLTFALGTGPSHGTLSGFDSATGEVTYKPDQDYNGPDSFTFTVTDDDTAGEPVYRTSAEATVSITVAAVNDQPVAGSTNVQTLENATVAIALLGSDSDPEVEQTLTFALGTGPSHGTLSGFNPTTGAVTYTPDPGYDGPDSFNFTVTDDNTAGEPENLTSNPGTVSINIITYEAHFDFGTSNSPVAAGYTRVSEGTRYSTARGYGWQSGTIKSRDRGTGSALERDLNFSPDGTFVVDVPNGSYEITVHLGDRGPFWHDNVGVYLEGALAGTVSTGNGQVVTSTYKVDVTDGQLTVRLRDLGGSDPNVCILGLDIGIPEPIVPDLSINDVSKLEGDSGTTDFAFTVNLSQAAVEDVTIDYSTADGTAVAPSDYTAASSTLIIPAGQTSQTIHVLVNGDTTIESDETFYVNLSNPNGATIVDNQGSGTIKTDDRPPTLTVSVEPGIFSEAAGDAAATGTVTRTGPTTSNVTVNLTSNETSEATVPASVTILAGQSSATFEVDAINDDIVDGTQSVTITAEATGYDSGTYTVQVTNDDQPQFEAHYDFGTANSPVEPGYTRVSEGTRYSASLGYGWQSGSIKSRDRSTGSALQRDLNFTQDGTFVVDMPNGIYEVTAHLGDRGPFWHDNVGVYLEGTLTGTMSTGNNQVTSRTYKVDVIDGLLTLRLRDLGGSDPNVCIIGLDIVTATPPVPSLSINDVSIIESDSSTKDLNFTVQLSRSSDQAVTVDYSTANGSAVAPSDYTATSGTLTIPAGQTSQTVSVSVNGDTTVESDETFYVNLSSPNGATIADGQGKGTIETETDEVPPTLSLSVSPDTFSEAAGDAAATGTVTRTGPTTSNVTVNLTSNDTSEATVPTTVIIDAGQSSATFEVNAINDYIVDGTQSVTLTAAATGYESGTDTVQVTDDDFSAHYDFGMANSPVQAGYTRVSEGTRYSAALGYGWQSGMIKSRDRNTGSLLDRDLNFTTDGTFAVKVPNGHYAVDMVLGDRGPYWHDQVGVYLEGALVDTVSTTNGKIANRNYEVDVTDGLLKLRLKDLGGSDPNACLEALDIALKEVFGSI